MVSSRVAEGTPQARIAAVLLNYRTPNLILNCLRTLVPEIDPRRDAIVVIDNASRDGSVQKIRDALTKESWEAVRLIEASRNGGFAAGNNLGIRAVEARASLLLNSDTLIRSGAVAQLWETLQSQPRIGVLSPRLEWPDGTPQISCFRLHTPWSELIAGSGGGGVGRIVARWEVPIEIRNEPFEPQWTSFAAVMIRHEVLEDVGFLDEGFFMYYEDVDYCRRVRDQGWQIWHEPRARVVHLRGGSSPVKALTAARKRRPAYYYAGRRRYFRKAFGPMGLVSANSLWTLGRAFSWVLDLMGRKRPQAVESELFDIWRRR